MFLNFSISFPLAFWGFKIMFISIWMQRLIILYYQTTLYGCPVIKYTPVSFKEINRSGVPSYGSIDHTRNSTVLTGNVTMRSNYNFAIHSHPPKDTTLFESKNEKLTSTFTSLPASFLYKFRAEKTSSDLLKTIRRKGWYVLQTLLRHFRRQMWRSRPVVSRALFEGRLVPILYP